MPPTPTAARGRWQATAVLAGTGLLCWRLGGAPVFALAGGAAALALLAWLAPGRYAPVQRGADRLTRLLLAGLTWLILGVVYLGLFTPLRAWRAVTRRDPLQLRPDPSATTYLRPVPPLPPAHFDRQF